jgi:hypothetical protein
MSNVQTKLIIYEDPSCGISCFMDPSVIQTGSAAAETLKWPVRPKSDPTPYPYPGHNGIDSNKAEGAQVIAICDGTVTKLVRNDNTRGNYIEYTSNNGRVLIRQCHAQSLDVTAKGQAVTTGQRLMRQGHTGDVDGTHVHTSILIDGKYADPYEYLTGAKQLPVGNTTSAAASATKTAMPTGGGSVPDKEQYYPAAGGWPSFSVGEYFPLCPLKCYREPDGQQIGQRFFAFGEKCVVSQIRTQGVTGIWGLTKYGWLQLCNTSGGGTHRRVNAWRVGGIPAGWAPQNIGF